MEGTVRILKRFINATLLISAFLLILNLTLLAAWVLKEMHLGQSPASVVQGVAEGLYHTSDTYALTSSASELLKQNDVWAMLIDSTGHVVWSDMLPDELPKIYSFTDVARFTQSFLMDYPVFVWEYDNGLVVVGYPKESIVKYQYILPIKLVSSLPIRIISLLFINITIALLLSLLIGNRLIRSIRPLIQGIQSIAEDREAYIEPKGVLSNLAKSVNQASALLRQKDNSLKKREEARSNWIAGISHDIRTPLSMVLGYSSDLEENSKLTEEQRQQAGIIRRQAENLRALVNDLNLVSMLEYEMQPINKKPTRLSVLAREIATEFLNNDLGEQYTLDINITAEDAKVNADEHLLRRSIVNLIHNSIQHNPGGCRIILQTSQNLSNRTCSFIVEDTGKGIPQKDLSDLLELPYSSNRKHPGQNGHGLGLPMAARIAKAHLGSLILSSDIGIGVRAEIVLPSLDSIRMIAEEYSVSYALRTYSCHAVDTVTLKNGYNH